jgi:hypothetical protein
MHATAKGTTLAALAAATVVTGTLGLASPSVSADDVRVAATPTSADPLVGTALFRDSHGDVRSGVDLWKARVTHHKALTVDLTHRDLLRDPGKGQSVSIYFDTDPAHRGPEMVLGGALFDGGDYLLVRSGWKPSTKVDPVQCRYSMRIDWAADQAHVRLGRGCLGDAAKVRVAVKAAAYTKDGDVVRDWLGGRRHLTRWVHRG